MKNFNLKIAAKQQHEAAATVASYNNPMALATLQKGIEAKARLEVSFGIDKNRQAYAWIKAFKEGVKEEYKILLNQGILDLLLSNLNNEDFVESLDATDLDDFLVTEEEIAEGFDFQLEVMKAVMEGGIRLSVTKRFTTTSYIETYAFMPNGRIRFYIKLSEATVAFLREKNLY